jgi:hypothetical protein
MFAYWSEHQAERDGLGPAPADLVKTCGVRIYAARAAVLRFRRGRVPVDLGSGLAPKTVKNIHRMLHRAFSDAVAWEYLVANPAEHASLPREQRRTSRTRPKPWMVDELTAWLRLALSDRFAAMWLLAATTGMRRSELAGVDCELLDLDARTLAIEDTRVVVAGYTIESDGKSNAGMRVISLDEYTVGLLRAYLAVLDDEREAFGTGYDTSHHELMRYPDGRALHADTITSPAASTGWWTWPGSDASGCTTCGTATARSPSTRACTPRSSVTGSGMPTRGSPWRSTGTVRPGTTGRRPSWSLGSSTAGCTASANPGTA